MDSKTNETKARGYFYTRGDQLNYRCFNCNASTTFAKLLKDIDTELYKEYNLEKFQSKNVIQKRTTEIPILKFGKLTSKSFEHCEWCNYLPETHYCIQYLNSRKIPKDRFKLLGFAENYQQFATEVIPDLTKTIINEPRLVIPFYDQYNELVGISGRALDNSKLRYLTLKIEDNYKLIYGLERLNKKLPVAIVEGPLDSLFLDNCLAAGNADLLSVVNQLNIKNVTMIWDNESRNKTIVDNMTKSLKAGYNIVIWPDTWKYKDINQAIVEGETKESIETIITENTFVGLVGLMRLNNWKKI